MLMWAVARSIGRLARECGVTWCAGFIDRIRTQHTRRKHFSFDYTLAKSKLSFAILLNTSYR